MKTENQIDHFCLSKRFRSLQGVRFKRGADAATDHYLIVAKVKLKLKKYLNNTSTGNNTMLTNEKSRIQNRTEQSLLSPSITTEDHWQQVKQALHELVKQL